eukprot:5214328-Lingulodinium_polyedra.AAC.1
MAGVDLPYLRDCAPWGFTADSWDPSACRHRTHCTFTRNSAEDLHEDRTTLALGRVTLVLALTLVGAPSQLREAVLGCGG